MIQTKSNPKMTAEEIKFFRQNAGNAFQKKASPEVWCAIKEQQARMKKNYEKRIVVVVSLFMYFCFCFC